MFKTVGCLKKEADKHAFDVQQKQALPVISGGSLPRQEILTAFKGGGITFFGQLFQYTIRFAFGIIITRTIGAEQFGLYTLGLLAAEVTAVIAGLALSAAAVRFVPIFVRERDEKRLWGTIQIGIALPVAISLFLGATILAFADPLAQHVFNKPDLVTALRLAGIIVPLSTLLSAATSTLRGFKRMDYNAYTEAIGFEVVKLVAAIAFLGLGFGLMGALTAYAVAKLSAIVLALYFIDQLFPLNRSLRAAHREPGKMLSFSLPLYLGTLLLTFKGSLETLVLGIVGSAVSVGVFSAALRISDIGRMFYRSLATATMPIVSDLYHRKNRADLGRFYQAVTKWAFAFNLPVFLTVTLFAYPVLSIFGEDFTTGITPLIVLAFGTLASAATGINLVIISMTGHTKISFINSATRVGVALMMDVLLIPRWNMVGAAIATVASIVTINVMGLLEVYFLFKIWPYNLSFFKPIAASLVAGAVSFVISRWLLSNPDFISTILNITILWLVYAGTLWVLKLSEDDRLVLNALQNRLKSALAHR